MILTSNSKHIGSANKNMKAAPISKKTIIFIIVILALGLVYFYFAGGEAPAATLLTGVGGGGVGATELSLLNQMKSLQIDTGFFKDPAYQSLVDYSVAITPQNVGRPNPFAPLPGVPNPFAPEPPSGSVPQTGR